MRKVLILGATAPAEGDPPVWIVEHGGKLLIEQIAEACAPLDAQPIFAMLKSDSRRHHLAGIARLAAPTCAVVEIEAQTQGAACTALLCIDHIEADDELVIMNANEIIDADLAAIAEGFRTRSLDAGVVTFPSLHPRYSYVLLDEEGRVVQAAEKRPISRSAIAGFFWFRKGADFVAAAQAMIRKDAKVDDHFFVSLTLNELILNQQTVGVHEIEPRRYQPLKSSRQVLHYETES
ncbi:MAG: glycosyltransferase family 2 protein [Brevundimonas sp.]